MKYIAMDLEEVKGPISSTEEELGMCFLEAKFRFYQEIPSSIALGTELELFACSPTKAINPRC